MPIENFNAYPLSGLNGFGIAAHLGATQKRLLVQPQPMPGPLPYPVRESDMPGIEELRRMVAAGDLSRADFDAAVKKISQNAGFNVMSQDELDERIQGLPLLTQQQLLAEMRTQPKMRTVIASLIAQPNPQRMIFLDQLKTVAQVYRPGSYPGHTSRWPVLQAYVRQQMAQMRARAGRRQMQGLSRYDWEGRRDEIPSASDRGWGLGAALPEGWEDEVRGWWDDQGKDLFKSYAGDDLASAAKGIVGLEGGDGDEEAEEIRRQAVLEQQRALEQAAPEMTKTEEPEAKGISWGWVVAAAAGIAALAGVAVVATASNPMGPLPRRMTRENAGASWLWGPVGGIAAFLALRHLWLKQEQD